MLQTIKKTLAAIVLVLMISVPLTSVVSAQGPGSGMSPGNMQGPHREDNGAVFVSTDIISIRAINEIPSLHFWYSSDENGTVAKFLASFMSLIEYEDHNDDGAFQANESLYYVPLAAYEWALTTGTVEDGDGTITEIWLKYTKGGSKAGGMPIDPPMPGPGHPNADRFEDVTLQFWAHIYLNDYTGNVSDDQGVRAQYLVQGESELKIDIEIGNFPFSSEDSKVALQSILREDIAEGEQYRDQYRFRTREQMRNTTGSSNADWTTSQGNETRFQQRNETHTQRIEFLNQETGETSGFFTWLDTASVTLPNDETEAVNVTASYAATGEGLALYLCYPNFDGGTLVHDPSIGVIPGHSPVTEFPVDIGTLVVAAFVIAAIVIVSIAQKKR